jgi:hypothetical protein
MIMKDHSKRKKTGFTQWLCVPVVALTLFVSLSPLRAQNLTSGADFLKIDSGARSQGMGGAFTAVADDVNALTWNPAGIAFLKTRKWVTCA